MFFLRIFFFKPTERTSVLLKNGARSFRNCSLLERSACFYETIAGNFERFDFKFKTKFLKLQVLFKKLVCRFLFESTKIENATVPYKIALPEANVNANRMGSTKWTYHKERIFASKYYIFSKILFQFKNHVQSVDLIYQTPKCSYS